MDKITSIQNHNLIVPCSPSIIHLIMVLHFLNIKQSLLGVEGSRCQRRSYINSADKCLPWFLSIVLVHCLADPVYNPQRGSHFNKQVMLAQRWFIVGSTCQQYASVVPTCEVCCTALDVFSSGTLARSLHGAELRRHHRTYRDVLL